MGFSFIENFCKKSLQAYAQSHYFFDIARTFNLHVKPGLGPRFRSPNLFSNLSKKKKLDLHFKFEEMGSHLLNGVLFSL